MAYYLLALTIGGVAASYAAVPLYKIFCTRFGFGGATRQVDVEEAQRRTKPIIDHRPITVTFSASVVDTLKKQWKFEPQQKAVQVVPGETALAFFTATNLSDEPIVGVASYNITPIKAGLYFNKIQCFCFDQQRLRPKETVDMPVFFYIDPEFADDPKMNNVNDIVLSYTFFKAKNQNVDLQEEDKKRDNVTEEKTQEQKDADLIEEIKLKLLRHETHGHAAAAGNM